MSIRPSPLLGYNNNVRHSGKVFHIQTEDSGVKYGHIMTHLFADGGRIIKSVKTSYTEYVGNDRVSEIVREMMKQQHKAMFIALRDGKFDAVADLGVVAPALRAPGPAPAGLIRAQGPSTPLPAAPPESARAGRSPPIPPPPLSRIARAEGPASFRSGTSGGGTMPPESGEPPEELALDIDALARAAAVDDVSPASRSSSDLPPPPSDWLREKTAPSPLPATPSPAPSTRRPSSTGTLPVERRYAPTRPASIFGQARPQQGRSIFGEDLLSDKSLDEVILSYLADDVEDEK